MPAPSFTTTTASQQKPRQYDKYQWSEIRPIFKDLYIDQDLSLGDTLQELRSKYNVHVTESMCKRRLHSWGLAKNAKSGRKAEALQDLPGHSLSAVASRSGIRSDNLLRYQKQCHKRASLAALEQDRTGQVVRYLPVRPGSGISKPCQQAPTTRPQHDQVRGPANPPTLPGEYLSIDASLRAVKDLISSQAAINKQHSSSAYVKIGNLIQSGMSLWEVNASTAAVLMFSNAAEAIHSELQRGIPLDVRFVYYLCPEVWGEKSRAHSYSLRGFLGSVVQDQLGSAHPMSLVVRNFQRIESGEARLRIWDYLWNNFVKPEEYETIWWDLSKARWQFCRRIGLFQQAAESCRHTLSVMRALHRSTVRMEVDVLMELTRLSFELAHYNDAMAFAQDLIQIAQGHSSYCWQVLPLALIYLAQIHEIHLHLDKAQRCLQQRLEVVAQNDGIQGAQTLRCCRDLLRFWQRNPGLGPGYTADGQYGQICDQLASMTGGCWDSDVASGGSSTAYEWEMSQTNIQSPGAQELKRELFELETCASSG